MTTITTYPTPKYSINQIVWLLDGSEAIIASTICSISLQTNGNVKYHFHGMSWSGGLGVSQSDIYDTPTEAWTALAAQAELKANAEKRASSS